MSRLTLPVSVDLNGKAGVHQTSDDSPSARSPIESTLAAKSSAAATVIAFGF
jgi:hypothetical protein